MPTQPEVDQEFERVDVDGDGVITREEFHAAYSSPGSPPPPNPTGGLSWSALSSGIQDSLKPHDRFQSGIVKEHVFLAALQQHGVDPGHPAVARMLEYSSDSGHVMYKQFFRDAQARDKPKLGDESPFESPHVSQFSTPLAPPSGALTPASEMDTGDDRQRLAKSRIAVAELRMEVERLRDALMDADVERKAAEMELQAVRKQSRESGTSSMLAAQDTILKLERQNRALGQQLEDERQAHTGELQQLRGAHEEEMRAVHSQLDRGGQSSAAEIGALRLKVKQLEEMLDRSDQQARQWGVKEVQHREAARQMALELQQSNHAAVLAAERSADMSRAFEKESRSLRQHCEHIEAKTKRGGVQSLKQIMYRWRDQRSGELVALWRQRQLVSWQLRREEKLQQERANAKASLEGVRQSSQEQQHRDKLAQQHQNQAMLSQLRAARQSGSLGQMRLILNKMRNAGLSQLVAWWRRNKQAAEASMESTGYKKQLTSVQAQLYAAEMLNETAKSSLVEQNAALMEQLELSEARAAELQAELHSVVGGDPDGRTHSVAAVVAKTAMREFYDETALMEQQHDQALRSLEALQARLARTEHVTAVLTKTCSPWTVEERQRIGKGVQQSICGVESVQLRVSELEQHTDKLGDLIRGSAAMAGGGALVRVLEETQLMMLDLKDSLKQLSEAAQLAASCLGVGRAGSGPAPRLIGDSSVEALMAEQEQAVDALCKTHRGEPQQLAFQLDRLQRAFDQERELYNSTVHAKSQQCQHTVNQLAALSSVSQVAAKMWAAQEGPESSLVGSIDELGVQWYNAELSAARSNGAGKASNSALKNVEDCVAELLQTLQSALQPDLEGTQTMLRSQELRKGLTKFRMALLEAGVLMAALEAVAAIAGPQLSGCLEQLSLGKVSLGAVMQAANEVASMSLGEVQEKPPGSSGVDGALQLTARESDELVINSMRLAERLKMVSDKAKQKSCARRGGSGSDPAVLVHTRERLASVQQLVQQLHHGTVGGLLQSREAAIEAEVQRVDVLAGHMHTLASIATKKLAPSVVNESVLKMASEVSHLQALQATFKAEEHMGVRCVQAANRIQLSLKQLRRSSMNTVSLIKELQGAMGVQVPPTPHETHQSKLHQAVRADMEQYRGALDIQIIEAKGLRAHTAGPEGQCVCGVKVKDSSGEVISSWCIARDAAKPACSAQWMQSTPFTDKLQMVGADCTLELEVLELPNSGTKCYMGGAVLKLLPLVSEQTQRKSFGTDADLSEAPLVLSMQHAPESSEGEAAGSLHVQVTLEPEDDQAAQRGRRIAEHAADLTDTGSRELAEMPVHERAALVAEAARGMKRELCELLSAQHALVVTSLGGKPMGWSAAVASVDEPDDTSELEELQHKIEQLQDQIASMPAGLAKSEAHKMVLSLEEERLTKSGLGLRRIVERSVWEGNGPMQELEDVLAEVGGSLGRVAGCMVEEWDEVASWCDLSSVWVESKLFESACYASYARMHSDVMQHSDAILMAVSESMAVLGGSYRWDDTYEDIYHKLTAAKETVGSMKEHMLNKTVADNIVTQGELLELASVVSHLQEENQMLWDRVRSTDQAMVQANKSLEHAKESSAGGEARDQQLLAEANQRVLEQERAQVKAEQQAREAEAHAAEERRAHQGTREQLEQVQRLASREDEATLKEHRRRLTEELLDVESKLVAALEEREQLKRLLEGDSSVQVDKEYWASAMAMLLERAQLHENQTMLTAQCQEAQLQNRALASQVVELENQLIQAQTALNAWNALNSR